MIKGGFVCFLSKLFPLFCVGPGITNMYVILMVLFPLSFMSVSTFINAYLAPTPTQVDEILRDQPEVKEKVFTILKQYAAERKVEYLAYTLSMILTKESHQLLIDNIRYKVISNYHVVMQVINTWGV